MRSDAIQCQVCVFQGPMGEMVVVRFSCNIESKRGEGEMMPRLRTSYPRTRLCLALQFRNILKQIKKNYFLFLFFIFILN